MLRVTIWSVDVNTGFTHSGFLSDAGYVTQWSLRGAASLQWTSEMLRKTLIERRGVDDWRKCSHKQKTVLAVVFLLQVATTQDVPARVGAINAVNMTVIHFKADWLHEGDSTKRSKAELYGEISWLQIEPLHLMTYCWACLCLGIFIRMWTQW